MLYNNVMFALVSSDEEVITIFYGLANKYRERFYFFHYRLEEEQPVSAVYAVGNNYTRRFDIDSKEAIK